MPWITEQLIAGQWEPLCRVDGESAETFPRYMEAAAAVHGHLQDLASAGMEWPEVGAIRIRELDAPVSDAVYV